MLCYAMLYYTIRYYNIMECNNKYYIIDLETVTGFDVYNLYKNKYFSTNNSIYERLVLYLKRIPFTMFRK